VYRTVVSELMLQQTQVATVLPYFERWMSRLPDFEALAAASEETVLKLWEGLGYYRRARFLHRLAREIIRLPALPRTAAEWRALPGIGDYTAAAIASIACGEAVACVDGNVVRILARLTADDTPFATSAAAVKRFTPLAEALLDECAPGRHNEAMMELGATLCTKRRPACTVCPVASLCAGRASPEIEAIPRIGRAKTEQREVRRAWVRRDGELLLHRIPKGSVRMAGLHELPTLEHLGRDAGTPAPDSLLTTRRRTITRYQITEKIHRLPPPKGPLAADLVWVAVDAIGQITLSGPHRRWVRELLAAGH